ncbi:copper resistance protein CopD [Bailinhaonella thermotolerans]|uniref:Copper resistance protein CopD n=1 Tax=Bailinhaonella thermotolerans TaxID=1070861 RepID=A0A3A4AZU6_9ACTN|nr:copper resistance protein CopD [Bailinhaonella thermotolerans]
MLVGGLVAAAVAGALAGTALTAPAPVPGLPEPGPVVRHGLPVVRVLLDLAAMMVVGLSLLSKMLGFDRPDRTEPVMRIARPWAVRLSLVWAACALIAVVLQSAEVSGVSPAAIWTYVDQVSAGKGLLFSAFFALVCAGVGRLAVRFGEHVPAELRIVTALFGLLPLPVTGHAADWYWHDYSMISMELHVMTAAAWTGGLVAIAVLVAPRKSLLALALPRYSKVATVCLGVATVTGLVNGLVQIWLTEGAELPGSLFTSGYGQLVIAKTLCLVGVALLGARIRFRLIPLIVQERTTALVAWAAAEATVMGLAYGLAVVLTRAPITG